MERLINAENFKRFCHEQLDKTLYTVDEILEMINMQPTAYDVEKVMNEIRRSSGNGYRDIDGDYVPPMIETKDAIEIVKQGDVGTDDVCEYKIIDKMVYAGCNNKQIASAFCWLNECDDYKYCPYCSKKIKVVE